MKRGSPRSDSQSGLPFLFLQRLRAQIFTPVPRPSPRGEQGGEKRTTLDTFFHL